MSFQIIIDVDDNGSMKVGGTIPTNKVLVFGAIELTRQALQKHYEQNTGLIQQLPPGAKLVS